MSKRLFLIRHGLTEWNEQKRYQGQKDIPLNEKGCQQARNIGEVLADQNINQIYSSDLKRARETADIINNHHELDIETNKKIREINFGKWQGMTYDEIEEEYPEAVRKWNQDPVAHPPPEGETLAEFQKRVKNGFQKIIEDVDDEENLIIVSHGGTIKVYLTTILDMPPENHWQFNISSTGLSIIDYYDDNKPIIITLNSVEHLQGLAEFKKYRR